MPTEAVDHPSLVDSREISPRPDGALRLFSLNVAHGRSTSTHQALLKKGDTERNVLDIADVVRHIEPDVVALQEADGPSAWSGNFDHVEKIAREADLLDHVRGDHNPFGFGRFNLRSGTALVSRWPIDRVESHRFALNWRDTKGFVVGAVEVPHWGREIDVVSVHLDFLRPSVRRRQILQMVDVLIKRRRPRILLGDLNCCFQREPRSLRLFEETLGLRAHDPHEVIPTFPSTRPRRRIDWILASEDLDFADYRTLRVPLSDHLVVVADLLPKG